MRGRERCWLRAGDKHYMYYRKAEKFTLLKFPMQDFLVLLGAK
jgi:hypothetical protein